MNDSVANTVHAKHHRNRHDRVGSILAIDVGGSKVKMLVNGETTPHKAPTGPDFTPDHLLGIVKHVEQQGWTFDAVTIGIPAMVGVHGLKSEPGNLRTGWFGFDFASALGVPVKIVNDAVMQALGSYDNGRMVFLGLGTGIGSALIADHFIVPLELGQLRFDAKRTINGVLNRQGLFRYGKRPWRRVVNEVVAMLLRAFLADYVVLGGGNSALVDPLPPATRRGRNENAIIGGQRLWQGPVAIL